MDVFIRILNSLLMFALPLALAVFLVRRFRLSWRIFLIGAGTFVGAEIFAIPFGRVLLQPVLIELGLGGADRGWPLVMVGISFGLVAGVFEEGARYVVLRRWLKDERSWKGAILYGLGHGGMEALLLGGLALYVLLQAIAYRNADLATLVPPEQLGIARAQLDVYWSAPWHAALLGALERVFAVGIQISLAVIVLQVFTRKNHIWLLVAVAWHTFVDAVAVFGVSTWGIYTTELLIGMLALLSLGIIFLLKPRGKIDVQDLSESEHELSDPQIRAAGVSRELSSDQIEDSRYDSG